MHFDIWGWEGIMNELIIARRATAKQSLEDGYETISRIEIAQANRATDYLEDRGYYND